MYQKSNKKANRNLKLSRKQLRREKRKEKKVKRNEYYTKRRKQTISAELNSIAEKLQIPERGVKEEKHMKKNPDSNKVLSIEELHKKEKKEQKKVQKDMSKQRKGQLLKANVKEDQTIKKLEKQLKLNKRKTKAVPKSFSSDGLDYLLEICDPEYMKNAASAQQDLNEGNDDFEEDLALMTGHISRQNRIKKATNTRPDEESGDDNDSLEDFLNMSVESDDDNNISDEYDQTFETDSEKDTNEINIKQHKVGKKFGSNKRQTETNPNKKKIKNEAELEENSEPDNNNEQLISTKANRKRKIIDDKTKNPHKKRPFEETQSGDDQSEEDDSAENVNNIKKDENTWEDIYGRLRSKDGSVLNNTEGKYVPPAIRGKTESTVSEDKKRQEKLERLKKQLKGLLNRLAEGNMHNIARQIEDLYMNNSRNDMNKTLTSLVTESLISSVLSPERLLMEHILLIAILHANVGTEVGAHFLQTLVKQFDVVFRTDQSVEDKFLDNVVNILAQLYNFKLFDAKLLYEILHRLSGDFKEKNVDCILHILRSVGFGLRKDDPLALKNLILELQKQAASASEGKVNNSRVKFLLDILLAIKNNNVTKIPNYDTTYSEHLKKIMKGFIRKGNYVTPLNISLEDLLKADERGKWWVVGSAWTGNIGNNTKQEDETTKSNAFSQKLLDLARKQRMNTDTRRDIFCIIMSAEDYLDAFEKLSRLGLKNQQEREIINVILHCCLQEKIFNPYYAILAQKFCDHDRKFQMTIKCSVWDKLKTLKSHSGGQISNLAKLLTHLFIEKGLPISTLKIVEFSELDKITLRLMRQILLGILLHNELESVQGVFEKVAQSDKLKMFRESLRLFIHHFLLRNLNTESVPEDQKQTLEERAKMVEKILTAKDARLRL